MHYFFNLAIISHSQAESNLSDKILDEQYKQQGANQTLKSAELSDGKIKPEYEFKPIPLEIAKDIIENELKDYVITADSLQKLKTDSVNTSLFKAQYIDLNNDGIPELIILPDQITHEGYAPNNFGDNHDQLTWVYEKIGSHYQKILSARTGGTYHRLLPLNSITNGYLDLVTETNCCAVNSFVTLYIFNGREYKANKECIFDESTQKTKCYQEHKKIS